MLTAAELSNDINAMKALLADEDQIVGLKTQLNTCAVEIENLKLWIASSRVLHTKSSRVLATP
jgi:hypothetical protein